MASGSPQYPSNIGISQTRWLVPCFFIGILCFGCVLVILGGVWLGRNKIPVIRAWLATLTPSSTTTYTSLPTYTSTTTPTETLTPTSTDTPEPTHTQTPIAIPTTRTIPTPTFTPKPSLIPGNSPFLPPHGYPKCNAPRTDTFLPGSNFETFDGDYASGEIVSGEYRMTMKDPNSWAYAMDGSISSDAIYEVDVEQTGIGSGAYGLIFGADSVDNPTSFYAFVVDSNTNFGIFRHTLNSEWQTVLDWHNSQLLYAGGSLNHIVVIRSGPMIAFFANGFVLTSAVFDDNIIGSYFAGLIAWSNATAGLQATFDNYSVCPLSEKFPMPVYAGLENTLRMPADQPVLLHLGWLASSRSQANLFVDLAEITLKVNGQEYVGFQEYWEPVLPYSNGYGVDWNLPLVELSPGLHRIDYVIKLKEQITDGFDLDGNGKLDQYGPGEVLNGWVEINSQK